MADFVSGDWSLLVEEGLEDDDFVSLFNEAHEGAQHAFVCTGGDGDLGVWIDLSAKERRICICYCLLQSRPPLSIIKPL